MTVEFECHTNVPASVQETFDRSRSIDLHQASMADSRERAVAGVTSGLIGVGEEVTWRAWHFGVPIRMTSRITSMTEPDSFVDEQVRGPFRSFRHEHEFRPNGSGTLMIDRVRFAAPLGPLGAIAELVLGPYMRRLIGKRNTHIATSAKSHTIPLSDAAGSSAFGLIVSAGDRSHCCGCAAVRRHLAPGSVPR